jgi:hypothetical protein
MAMARRVSPVWPGRYPGGDSGGWITCVVCVVVVSARLKWIHGRSDWRLAGGSGPEKLRRGPGPSRGREASAAAVQGVDQDGGAGGRSAYTTLHAWNGWTLYPFVTDARGIKRIFRVHARPGGCYTVFLYHLNGCMLCTLVTGKGWRKTPFVAIVLTKGYKVHHNPPGRQVIAPQAWSDGSDVALRRIARDTPRVGD